MSTIQRTVNILGVILLTFGIFGCQEKKKSLPNETTGVEKENETSATNSSVVPLIFDTDIAEDYDDVGAMAMLHALADMGEIDILATISSNSYELTGPTISVLNTYFNRPDIPIGVTRSDHPNRPCNQGWAQAIINDYPHDLKSNEEAMGATELYRKILSEQPDGSVTIVTVGFLTNMANLINSAPDEYSSLSGKELVEKKVKSLVAMAARLDEGEKRGREYNVHIDGVSAKTVFDKWNTPFLLSPYELGVKVLTGIPLINDASIQNSPVKDAYKIALAYDKNTKGRMSWDQTAVLVAARGAEPYFNTRMLNMEILDDGTNVVIPGERIAYLSLKESPKLIEKTIEKLMAHQPQHSN